MATTDEGQTQEAQAQAEQDRRAAMAAKDREAPKDAPTPTRDVSHQEIRESLRKQGVRPTGNTASGLAASPQREIIDTAIEPEGVQGEDNLLNPGTNSDAQTKPALFTSNGSLPYGHVPSPGGPVPVAVHTNPGAQQAGVDAMVEGAIRGPRMRRRVTQDHLDVMSKAEIRAVAHDRGYDVGTASGRGVLKSKFLEHQDKDQSVEEENDATATLVSSTPTAPVPTSAGGTGTVPVPASNQQSANGANQGSQAETGAPQGPPGGSLS